MQNEPNLKFRYPTGRQSNKIYRHKSQFTPVYKFQRDQTVFK